MAQFPILIFCGKDNWLEETRKLLLQVLTKIMSQLMYKYRYQHDPADYYWHTDYYSSFISFVIPEEL